MFLHVDGATHLGEYRVWLEFRGGSAGEVDLEGELTGEVFEPLKNLETFKSFGLHGYTLWGNGADFAPEFLCELMVSQGKATGHA